MTDITDIQTVIDGAVRGNPRGALLPLLHELQKVFGFIDPAAVPRIAAALNLSRAEVHGVISFYPDFRTEPPARHVVALCRAESCQARGGKAVEAALVGHLGIDMGEVSRDGQVALEPVYCLGLCAIGPNALVDGRPVARIDSTVAEKIARELIP